MQLILASQSPRRKELLGLFQIPFTVCAANIDETMDPTRPVAEEVARLSREKALAVEREPEDVVIAADTVVVLDGEILGKPRDVKDAYRMLKLLSGSVHQIMTGMTVLRGEWMQTHTEISEVKFRHLTDKEINDYSATGEPMDKAGAYAIQLRGALFVEAVHGDYSSIVGLPVCRLRQMLLEAAPELMGDMA